MKFLCRSGWSNALDSTEHVSADRFDEDKDYILEEDSDLETCITDYEDEGED